jgi:hypothetical protein
MARTSAPLPPWVAIVGGALVVAAVGWRLVGSEGPAARWVGSLGRAGLPSIDPGPGPAPAPPSTPGPPRVSVRTEVLGRHSTFRFAFDPETPGRVVTCESESRDGGRTWRRLGDTPAQRSIALGSVRAAVPAVGPAGRVLCGETILPAGGGAATRVGEIQAAVEWTGTTWRPMGLPPVPAGDSALALAVGYAADGTARSVRGDRLLTPHGERTLPGRAHVWAVDGAGVVYASLAAGTRRPRVAWSDGELGEWHALPTPGEAQAIATAGERAWIAAEMLGRGRRDRWEWTPWPPRMRPEGLTVHGETVVAWGTREGAATPGSLAVSRDGGATLATAGIDRLRVIWAALDPHHPSELLVMGDDGTLARARID